ncbi:MAG: hypothetical protein HZA03_11990 [Nitrospinae bacterium]|nr:hypothetical protein [Nitrospinota bacterium]
MKKVRTRNSPPVLHMPPVAVLLSHYQSWTLKSPVHLTANTATRVGGNQMNINNPPTEAMNHKTGPRRNARPIITEPPKITFTPPDNGGFFIASRCAIPKGVFYG